MNLKLKNDGFFYCFWGRSKKTAKKYNCFLLRPQKTEIIDMGNHQNHFIFIKYINYKKEVRV